jgi:hypothetical protein
MVNIGGNLVSLAGMQQAVRPTNAAGMMQGVQTLGGMQVQQLPTMIQIPVSVNGQTVMQTVQLPVQAFHNLQQATLTNGGLVSLGQGQLQQGGAQGTPTLNVPTINTSAEDDNSGKSPEKDKNGNQAAAANAAAMAAQQANLLNTQQAQNLLFNQALNSNFGLALSGGQGGMTLIPVNGANLLSTPTGQMILTSQGMAVTSFAQPSASTTTTSSSPSTTTASSQQNATVMSSVLSGQQLLAGQNLQGQLIPPNFLQVGAQVRLQVYFFSTCSLFLVFYTQLRIDVLF